jgi:hypothetical protein
MKGDLSIVPPTDTTPGYNNKIPTQVMTHTVETRIGTRKFFDGFFHQRDFRESL